MKNFKGPSFIRLVSLVSFRSPRSLETVVIFRVIIIETENDKIPEPCLIRGVKQYIFKFQI